jgi:hypothetical protein
MDQPIASESHVRCAYNARATLNNVNDQVLDLYSRRNFFPVPGPRPYFIVSNQSGGRPLAFTEITEPGSVPAWDLRLGLVLLS